MTVTDTLDVLYSDLATTWDPHQRLRLTDAPLTDLAASSARLYQARIAMWDWQRNNDWRAH